MSEPTLGLILIFLLFIIMFIGWKYDRNEQQEKHTRNIETNKIEILREEQNYRHSIGRPFHPKQLNKEDEL